MDSAKYAGLFRSESREQLRQCEALLLEWERAPQGAEPVADLFRVFHSIKGMAATMGYTHLAAFTHEAEHLLDGIRGGRIAVSDELIGLMVEVVDAVRDGVEDAVAGSDGRRIPAGLLSRLSGLAAAQPDLTDVVAPEPDTPPAPAGPGVRVALQIKPGVAMPWARALVALQKAGRFGTVGEVIPLPSSVDPERFDGRLAFHLATESSPEEVREALMGAGELAECLVEPGTQTTRPVALAAAEPDLRVERAMLDRLLAEVGELLVSVTRLAGHAEQRGDPRLEVLASEVARWSDAVHTRVLDMRMEPVSTLFQRVTRAVRDLSRELGKRVRLEVTGREIEVDRSILDAMGEPLLHLVRNAVDHGLETPDARRAAGKPAEGVLQLSARRVQDGVELVVADDGCGVDRRRVREKARVAAAVGGETDDQGLLELLARPGLSTAEAVTGVSGRGVGMDAVVTRVRGLGGTISLRSTEGKGTTFILQFPETLAVVPALLVAAGDERYAVPLVKVVETGRAVPVRRETGLVVTFRGEDLPATDLRDQVGLSRSVAATRRPFLVVPGPGGRLALLVDRLLGRQDLVVSPVEHPAGAPPWLSGAATLADGVPALLIDPAGMTRAEAA